MHPLLMDLAEVQVTNIDSPITPPEKREREEIASWEYERVCKWLKQSAAGYKRTYHLGYLIYDRVTDLTAHNLGILMAWSQVKGLVHLTQRRSAVGCEYIATRTALNCLPIPSPAKLRHWYHKEHLRHEHQENC
jgi:hypothetical protein